MKMKTSRISGIVFPAARMAAVAVALLLMAACSSTKNATKGGGSGKASSAAACVEQVAANFQTAEYITAKTSVELQSGSKSFTLGGNLRMKRNDVIQLSMTFLGMEVARIEFTPQDVLVVDRFNKQYVKATYSEAGFLKSASLDFYVLQSMFWNEIFVPGERDVKSVARDFTMASSGDHTLLTLASSPKLDYDFLIKTADSQLDRVTVTPKNSPAGGESFVCRYGEFTDFGGKQFPTQISLRANGGKREVNMTINLSRLSNSSKWETRTKVPSGYKQCPVDEIMKKLSALQ